MTQPPAEPFPPPATPPAPEPITQQSIPAQPMAYPPPAMAYPPPPVGPHPPAPQVRSGVNGFAVASLVLGIIGGIVLSIIFSIVALVQIPKRNQRGKGLAVAGLIISGVWIIAVGVIVAIAIGTGATRDTSGGIVEGGTLTVTDLATGDCFNGLTEDGTVFSVDAVPCAEPHDAEVFAVFDLTGSDFPGDEEAFDQAGRGCNERLEAYSEAAVTDDAVELYVFHPTSQSWRQGDHEVTCIAGTPSGKRTGSIRD